MPPSSSLDRFLAPQSIAVIGASPERTKIRGQLLHMLRENRYPGRLYPVNPSSGTNEQFFRFAFVPGM